MRRAGRCVRVVPGVHRHPQGRHRAHPQGPRAGRHRGGRRRRSDRDLGRPLSHHYRLCVPEAAPGDLLDAARRGDRAALARLLSLIERGGDGARRVGRATHGLGLDAYTIGITGPPGAGKSTLTSALVDVVRRRNRDRVAVLAIDPSSPFSGGAILGDRVRMGDHALDEGVFIRSMATRGHLGGLAVAPPGEGVEAVWQGVAAHGAHLEASGGVGARRRARANEEVTRLVAARLLERARTATAGPRAAELADAVATGDVDPWTAADELAGGGG